MTVRYVSLGILMTRQESGAVWPVRTVALPDISKPLHLSHNEKDETSLYFNISTYWEWRQSSMYSQLWQ
jgi:hypothetical protein